MVCIIQITELLFTHFIENTSAGDDNNTQQIELESNSILQTSASTKIKPVKSNKKKKLIRVVTSLENTGDCIHYWIPRIHLMFLAEDPKIFSQRIISALQERRIVESHLRLLVLYPDYNYRTLYT